MSDAYGWRVSWAAGDVTDVGFGSGALFGVCSCPGLTSEATSAQLDARITTLSRASGVLKRLNIEKSATTSAMMNN